MRGAFSFWDAEIASPTHVSWLESEAVRRYVNRLVSGEEGGWPLDWFQRHVSRRFDRALSIGCGTGALERDLVRRGIVSRIDAFDGSFASIATAEREARNAAFGDKIHYFSADFNRVALPRNAYDLVVIHQALHHVAELEELYGAILQTLKSDGLLYFDEYIGPSRFDWNHRLIQPHRDVYNSLPADVRLLRVLPLPIQRDDPSEAYRSSEIISLAAIGFDVVARRDYGGNLLSVIFPSIDWTAAPPALLDELIEREQQELARGDASYHAVVVAKPKGAAAKAAALDQYRRLASRSRRQRRVRDAIRPVAELLRRILAGVARRGRRLIGGIIRA